MRFPGHHPRLGQAARLLRQLQAQGVEVHKADKAFKVKDAEYPAGSYVVRMDQPYSRVADMMLDRQYFNVNDPRPYDDVGWTLGPLYNVKTARVDDVAVLEAPMPLFKGEVAAPGGVLSWSPRGKAFQSQLRSGSPARSDLRISRLSHVFSGIAGPP